MKRFIFPLFALCILTGISSCTSEDMPAQESGDAVNIVINLPRDMQTRITFGDESKVTLDNLQWTIYEIKSSGEKKLVTNGQKKAFEASQTQESVTVSLVKGKTYRIAFYADNSSNGFVSYADGNVNVNYSAAVSNDREEDAFIGKTEEFTVTGPLEQTVTLTRPFAQLNWGTDDLDEITVRNIINDLSVQVEITTGLYRTMNVLTGELSDPVAGATLFPAVRMNALPDETFPVNGYTLMAMNYLLTGKGTLDCVLRFDSNVAPVKVNAVPVNENYRTNIYGSLLTAPGVFNLLIDSGWEDDYNEKQ